MRLILGKFRGDPLAIKVSRRRDKWDAAGGVEASRFTSSHPRVKRFTAVFDPPKAVLDATAGYLNAEDATSAWIDERCEREVKSPFETSKRVTPPPLRLNPPNADRQGGPFSMTLGGQFA
jgi:hypothetical protein